MSKLVMGGLAAVVIAVVAVGGWYFFIRDDAPPPVDLESALSSITTTPSSPTTASGTTASGTTAAAPTTAPNQTTGQATGVNGTWVPDTTQQTFLGYRVQEELVRIGATTAVGRTSGITGSVTIANNSVTATTITADLTKLASDSSQRDGQLRNQAIETSKFPNATFVLSEAIPLTDALANGEAFSTTLKGKLTLHGVTKDVSIPIEAKLQNGLLVIVGSTQILFSDYSISKPNGANVVSIEDKGILEIQLILKKS